MSQKNKGKSDAAEARTQQTRGFMQQVRVVARRKYTPEEKVRIVLEGFRRNYSRYCGSCLKETEEESNCRIALHHVSSRNFPSPTSSSRR